MPISQSDRDLKWAIYADMLPGVFSAVSDGADINGKDIISRTYLHQAVDRKRYQCVTALLGLGADYTLRDRYGLTPIMLAAEVGAKEAAILLAEAGADPVEGLDGKSPFWAFLSSPWATGVFLSQMITSGRYDAHCGIGDERPLAIACLRGMAAVVEALLAAGASVHARNSKGGMPIHAAALSGSEACIRILLDAGADPMARDDEGCTPLHYAYISWRSDGRQCDAVVRILTEHGADMKAPDNNGITPFDVMLKRSMSLRVGCYSFDENIVSSAFANSD